MIDHKFVEEFSASRRLRQNRKDDAKGYMNGQRGPTNAIKQ